MDGRLLAEDVETSVAGRKPAPSEAGVAVPLVHSSTVATWVDFLESVGADVESGLARAHLSLDSGESSDAYVPCRSLCAWAASQRTSTCSIGRYGGWGRYPYRRGYARGWHRGYRAGARSGYRAGRRNSSRNVYRTQNNRGRAAQQPGEGNRPAPTAPNRSNNVYTDRSGNVYRQDQNGTFQQRGQDGWQNRQPSAGSRSQLESSSQSRTRGTNRTQSFKSTRPSGGRGGRGAGSERSVG